MFVRMNDLEFVYGLL